MADTPIMRDLWIPESASAFNPLNQYSKLHTVALAWNETRPQLLSYSINEPAPHQPTRGGYKPVARLRDDQMFVIYENGAMTDMTRDVWDKLNKQITEGIKGRRDRNKPLDTKNYLSHAHRLVTEFRKILAHRAPDTTQESGPTPLTPTEQTRMREVMERARAEETRKREEAVAAQKAREEAERVAEEARKAAEKPAKRKISEMSREEILEARQRLSARLDALGLVNLRGKTADEAEAHRALILKTRENIGKLTRGLHSRGGLATEKRFSGRMKPARGAFKSTPPKPQGPAKK